MLRSVRVVPQKLLDPAHPEYVEGLADYAAGGRYLDAETGEDLTGQAFAQGQIGFGIYAPQFEVVEPLVGEIDASSGPIARMNIIRRSAGWHWIVRESLLRTDPVSPEHARYTCASHARNGVGWGEGLRVSYDPQKIDFLVSIEHRGEHVYAVRALCRTGILLATHPQAPSEPRLRPLSRGELRLGSVLGEIELRGCERPVYDLVTIVAAS